MVVKNRIQERSGDAGSGMRKTVMMWFSTRNCLVAQAASCGLYRLPEWRNAEKSESYPEAFAPQTTR